MFFLKKPETITIATTSPNKKIERIGEVSAPVFASNTAYMGDVVNDEIKNLCKVIAELKEYIKESAKIRERNQNIFQIRSKNKHYDGLTVTASHWVSSDGFVSFLKDAEITPSNISIYARTYIAPIVVKVINASLIDEILEKKIETTNHS